MARSDRRGCRFGAATSRVRSRKHIVNVGRTIIVADGDPENATFRWQPPLSCHFDASLGVHGMAICRTSGPRWVSLVAATVTALAAAAASAQQAPPRQTAKVPATPASKAAGQASAPAASSTRTRFIIGLERAVEPKVSALANPNRVLIDLPQVGLSLPDLPRDQPVGVVKGFRHAVSASGGVRIVIDATGPVAVEKSAVERTPDGKLYQLVLDIVATSELAAAPDTPTTAGLQPLYLKPVAPQQRRAAGAKPVIVIDPGHGGEDSGARKFGTVEKDVVLSFSLKLREKLAATGYYKVLMTRDRDIFIPLEERRAFAERNLAALFIAIHADYTQRSSARGATIYSLRPEVAESLRRSAEGEAREAVLSAKQEALVAQAEAEAAYGGVRSILAEKARDLIERNSLRTSVFARSVIDFVGSSTNLMDNPDRGAAFVVLKTARVPSILLELGYVTNTEDAQQLNSDQWRDKVSGSVAKAINKYVADCIDMAQC
jgi:N-acetylmuramoyl-L-alanine amidase